MGEMDWEKCLQTPLGELPDIAAHRFPSPDFYRRSLAIRVAQKVGTFHGDLRANVYEALAFIERRAFQQRIARLGIEPRCVMFTVMNFIVRFHATQRTSIAREKRLQTKIKRDLPKAIQTLRRLKELHSFLTDYVKWRFLSRDGACHPKYRELALKMLEDIQDGTARVPLTKIVGTLRVFSEYQGKYLVRTVSHELQQVRKSAFPSLRRGAVEHSYWSLVRTLDSLFRERHAKGSLPEGHYGIIAEILSSFGVDLNSSQISRKLTTTR